MQLTELVAGLGVADVVDAMMMTHQHRAHIIELRSPDPDRVLVGPAVTISFLPVRKDLMDPQKHSLGPAIYRAVAEHEANGAVLVMASNGYRQTSLGGGTKLSRVENLGMAGILADGMLRDFEELSTYNFATYCHGETVRAGGNEIQPYLADVPVAVGGVTVVPGDVIFAKGSTAVVIPGAEAEAILSKARQVMQKMDQMKEGLKSEDPQAVLSHGSGEL
ncbi:RraA family protein [Mycobacterium kansasii]|uniref:Putative 4-hydroxy-4-methyl-2-oxoglutarate aldolase n=3 Tax=Mycobacterium kansasii TaxID=1768 RepID=A0A1V3WPJ2_MYCKA|nr:RraA family protein [Mycobacterium kansasii]AGZ49380.1 dimethylmenaquinone methyltransferase [Mycobacterium kansasii ATCC 12478]ARG58671.1 dimethylmenaquinone methyltransferase [Mycobacterium kansasii]ARG64186.1 dimethylmenaquinone methyltransferase [Mycobacterium kansasii]ARG71838.1 dimethylmenaquinone methyltransferase [Mycobacterium kansasii]ARG73658.1 dimethylmenaquinone methyltransferase [Mycobacterium kansasii]